MRRIISFAALSLVLSMPAFATADSFNAVNREVGTGGEYMAWAYSLEARERNATKVLAQLRELCGSDHHYDQYYCARGMKVLKKAYAELQMRRAAEAAVAP